VASFTDLRILEELKTKSNKKGTAIMTEFELGREKGRFEGIVGYNFDKLKKTPREMAEEFGRTETEIVYVLRELGIYKSDSDTRNFFVGYHNGDKYGVLNTSNYGLSVEAFVDHIQDDVYENYDKSIVWAILELLGECTAEYVTSLPNDEFDLHYKTVFYKPEFGNLDSYPRHPRFAM